MTSRTIAIETLESQALASRPNASAWVSANAGSGKTHVLTQRVIRLLLEGVPASKLLCLTFTKAAASNMSLRVFNTLARWTSLTDEELRDAIIKMGARYQPELEPVARRLFARTIETPGGLKILTIHGFCESILHLFPFEANVPAGFEVIDDARKRELLNLAKGTTFAAARSDPALGAMLSLLANRIGEGTFDDVIDSCLKRTDILFEMSHAVANWPNGYAMRLAPILGLVDGERRPEIEELIVNGGIGLNEWASIAEALERCGKTDQDFADRIRGMLGSQTSDRPIAYLELLFKDGVRRGSEKRAVITKPAQKANPALLSRLDVEANRIEPLIDKWKACGNLEHGQALVAVATAVIGHYTRLKRASGHLDFDDLIAKTSTLLNRCDARWILYKLDSGIDHILVDEAQDTSETQWSILETLASEFTDGEAARSVPRTFFAVGDEKQSIFSFQGAAPHLFDETKRKFERKSKNGRRPFHDVKLNFSFRSAQGILDAVDLVFSLPENRGGLSSDDLPTSHSAWKSDISSLVEIWEPIGPLPKAAEPDWRLPLDAFRRGEPASILADRISQLLVGLLDPARGETVFDEGLGEARPIHGGDIMILLRRRGALFEALVRTLRQKGLPVAGADRLVLKDHIAVMDMIALARFCILPEDDLALACVMKSPLLGLDDEDLIEIAPLRKSSLIAALGNSNSDSHRLAFDQLMRWRDIALDSSPSEFFAAILDALGFRGQFIARLGSEAADVLDEFLRLALERERQEPPSLPRFIEYIESSDLEVKRDMEAAGRSIRIMTVHASKGLEAKIVILPDTCQKPGGRFDPQLFTLRAQDGGNVLAWSSRKDDDCAAIAKARAKFREEMMNEYRRLLYVAMTRAEERLYIMGYHGVHQPAGDCWHQMITRALSGRMIGEPSLWNRDEPVWRLRRQGALRQVVSAGRHDMLTPDIESPPSWINVNAGSNASKDVAIRPSKVVEPNNSLVKRNLDSESNTAIAIGNAIHELLHRLPGVDRSARARFGEFLLSSSARDIEASARSAVLEEALRIIDEPRLEALFAPTAVAEAVIAGTVRVSPSRAIHVNGRVDRLAQHGDEIWFADFKSGYFREPSIQNLSQIALYSAALAGAFPNKTIRAFLVGTKGPRILEYSTEALHPFLDHLTSP